MLESLLIKLQAFRCFPVNIAKFLRTAFFIEHLRWLLLQMFCFTLYFQKDVYLYILYRRIYCSHTLRNCFALKPKITFICFHSLYHSLSFIVPLIVIRCYSLLLVVIHCHSLLFVVTRCHSSYYSLSLVVIHCATRCRSLSLVVIRCHLLYHSLPLDIPLVCLFINDRYF